MPTREVVHLTGGLQPLLRARRAVREARIETLAIERQRLLRLIEHYQDIPGATSVRRPEEETARQQALAAAWRQCQETYAVWKEAFEAWQTLMDQAPERLPSRACAS